MTRIQTRSGIMIDLVNPKPDQIEILDIAHALSMTCRWGGHTKVYFSVAQHSVLCSSYTCAKFALAALMHDAAEAYIGDIPRPLKEILAPQIYDLEDGLMRVISEKFQFEWPIPAEVKEVDDNLLETERQRITCGLTPEYPKFGTPYNVEILPWSPHVANRLFLESFHRLHDHPVEQAEIFTEDQYGFKSALDRAMSGYYEAMDKPAECPYCHLSESKPFKCHIHR